MLGFDLGGFRMKLKEKEEARRLRKEEGLSVKKIAKQIGVSKGTVSIWVRDIELTYDQKAKLLCNSKMHLGHFNGPKKIKEKALERRKQYQEKGRILARQNDKYYACGCMLYWGEGDKSRNLVGMSNTDVDLLKFFVKFLRKYFNCKDEDFTICILSHLNNGLTVDDIHNYWLKELELPESCLRKFQLKTKYYSDTNIKNKKHIYGCCKVRVNSTELVQMIYGSIQEIIGVEKYDWLL